MKTCVLQIVDENHDSFWEVPRDALVRCLEVSDLRERRKMLDEQVTPTKVHCVCCDVDYVLVLDGWEDSDSWEELREALEAEG